MREPVVREINACQPGERCRSYRVGTVWYGHEVKTYTNPRIYTRLRGLVEFDVIAKDSIAARSAADKARRAMPRYPEGSL